MDPQQSPGQAQTPQSRPRRPWSVYIGRIAGIPVFLHATFILLLVAIAWIQAATKEPVLGGLAFVLAIFASVLLHEFGHAMMARHYGIGTQDVVLYPIGGIARLRSLGEGWQEFWIALAGPAVNVVIFAVCSLIVLLMRDWVPIGKVFEEFFSAPPEAAKSAAATAATAATAIPMLEEIAVVNLILLLFNMIPAFPMDGGRVLRAVLTAFMPKPRATAIAAKVGQLFAALFIVYGLLQGQIFLMIIGIFVFFAAGQEATATQSMSLLAGHRVRDAMITHFETLGHGDSLGRAAELLLQTTQHDFPVLGGGEVIGLLDRRALINGLSALGRDHLVVEVMSRSFPRIPPQAPLQSAFDLMRLAQGMPVLVFDGDRLVGYINQENLAEYLMIAQTRRAAG